MIYMCIRPIYKCLQNLFGILFKLPQKKLSPTTYMLFSFDQHVHRTCIIKSCSNRIQLAASSRIIHAIRSVCFKGGFGGRLVRTSGISSPISCPLYPGNTCRLRRVYRRNLRMPLIDNLIF